jgi:protein phosphatase 1D
MKGCSVKVGHILKLGLSTRLFLLQGPEQDMEDESELTVTQLKEKRQLELAAREIEKLECQRQEEERSKQEEDQGVDWGMGEFRYKPQLSDIFQSAK